MGSQDTRIVVFRHAGHSYVQKKQGGGYHNAGLTGYGYTAHINGKACTDFPDAIGDENFVDVVGDITSIAAHYPQRKVITHYVPRPEFTDTVKGPLSIAEYSALNEDRREVIYQPAYRMEDVPPRPMEYVVYEVDAAPRKFPPGVMITVPDYLRRYRNVWHTLPCFMEKKELFTRLADAVVAETKNRSHFKVGDHRNIGSLSVDAAVKVQGFPQEFSFRILRWGLTNDYGNTIVPQIQGDNLDDLLAKVGAWIGEQVERVRLVHSPVNCPCCGRKLPKDTKVVVAAGRR
ncbi:hypothetical protein [Shinella sp. JR1-6]|uniref:hypothetical protein n=1 Tax=Shinella sp. JR1-6 TaxID=2527671 RepID=UPI00102D4F91|nr:hypothetical protein [Shinella sp. JR1-6]TAA54588.1 hypothetical protein EXZ48_26550 [Shinella sp. JR1-6]